MRRGEPRRFVVAYTGSVYHSEGCQHVPIGTDGHLALDARRVTMREVRRERLRPCETCRPPRATLRVVPET